MIITSETRLIASTKVVTMIIPADVILSVDAIAVIAPVEAAKYVPYIERNAIPKPATAGFFMPASDKP